MFNPNKKENDVLEKFRIKAHLRSYVKDPIIIDESLLSEAVQKLKKLPHDDKDPTESIASELVLEAYRFGYFKYRDLTETGYELVRNSKYRGHHHLTNNRIFNDQTLRNCYVLKAI